MKIKYWTFTLLLYLLLLGRASGQNFEKLANQAQKKGQHCLSAIYASKALQLKPEKNKKAQKLLAESYPEAFRINQLHIRNLKSKSSSFMGDQTAYDREAIVNKYDSLMILQEEYALIPLSGTTNKKLQLKFEKQNLGSVQKEAKEKWASAKSAAAEMHYQEGSRLIQSDGLEENRAAAREFRKALGFVPGYKDSQVKLQEAQKKGIKRIVLIPFADKTYTSEYGDIGERIVDLIRANSQLELSTLVEFISPQEMADTWDINDIISPHDAGEAGKKLNAHEVWVGQVTQLIVPKSDQETNTRETLTRSVVVGEEKYTNKKGKVKTRNVYGDVSATVIKHTRSNDGTFNYSFQVVSVEKQSPEGLQTFKEEVSNSHSYYSFYSGDKRAFRGVEMEDRALPSFVDRTNTLIEDAATRVAQYLSEREKEIHIPLRRAIVE